jgi:hypothetical protein
MAKVCDNCDVVSRDYKIRLLKVQLTPNIIFGVCNIWSF